MLPACLTLFRLGRGDCLRDAFSAVGMSGLCVWYCSPHGVLLSYALRGRVPNALRYIKCEKMLIE